MPIRAACYDRGNAEPTVTDANIVLQALNPTHLLGGRMHVRQDLARAAVDRLAARLGIDALAAAQGIIAVVTANMARAIRLISVQRGHDPRDYTLIAFGGAGPLHAARLAAEFGRGDVWLPEAGAFFSCPLYDREQLGAGNRIEGPAIVEHMDATTQIVPDATVNVDQYLNLLIELPCAP